MIRLFASVLQRGRPQDGKGDITDYGTMDDR